MKSMIVAVALTLSLSACTDTVDGFLEGDPTRNLLIACGAITGAGNVLHVNRDHLSEDQVSLVKDIVAQAKPVCGADEPPTSRLALIEGLALQISAIDMGGE